MEIQEMLRKVTRRTRAGTERKSSRLTPGRSVLEIVAPHDGDTYRAVYTVKFKDAVYVFHAFQKKSTKGIATSQREIDLIRRRLADAEQHRYPSIAFSSLTSGPLHS